MAIGDSAKLDARQRIMLIHSTLLIQSTLLIHSTLLIRSTPLAVTAADGCTWFQRVTWHSARFDAAEGHVAQRAAELRWKQPHSRSSGALPREVQWAGWFAGSWRMRRER
eukprot:2495617-Rhodomonas_salina.1